MKTLWSMAEPRLGVQSTKRAFVYLAILVLINGAGGAVTPIPFQNGGTGTIKFDALPGLANGWATAIRAGGNGDLTNALQLDAAVQTNDVSSIATALGTDSTVTNATTMFGSSSSGSSSSAFFRWNSFGQFLGSRPVGNAYSVLLAAFSNDSGSAIGSVAIGYDYGLDLVSGASIDEDPRASSGSPTAGELAGFRVYYSLTGTPGSWYHIPGLDGTNQGWRTACIEFGQSGTAWPSGGNLYILWCDDNAVDGGTGTGPFVEGPNALDNVALFWDGVCFPRPPTIERQPHSVTVENCTATNLSVETTGPQRTFQWFKDGSPIPGATEAVYNIPSATARDAGTHFVRITSSVFTVESDHVSVTVVETNATVVSALVGCDRTTVVLSFSHRMDAATAQQADSYEMVPLNGGVGQIGASAVLSSDGTVLTLTLEGRISATKNYELVIQPNVLDCAGNSPGPLGSDGNVHVPLNYELCLVSIEGTSWRYNTNADDLGIAWRASNYDDSSWPSGPSVFDGKFGGPRSMVSGYAVMTQLPLLNPNYDDGTNDIPVYYFRTHFDLPTDVSLFLSLNLFTFPDDFDAEWLNGDETPIHVRTGLRTNIDAFGYSGGVAVGDAALEGPFPINPRLLRTGDNFIAAKVFQYGPISADVTFGAQLIAIVNRFGPCLSITFDGTKVNITWPDGTMHLYEATAPDAPPGEWTLVAGQSAGSTTISGVSGQPGETARFYSLRE